VKRGVAAKTSGEGETVMLVAMVIQFLQSEGESATARRPSSSAKMYFLGYIGPPNGTAHRTRRNEKRSANFGRP